MRRALSILLVLFFGLGPLTATVRGSDDSSLPACCRRQGTHHCAMADVVIARGVQASSGGRPILSAPTHCPLYPHGARATVASVHALTVLRTPRVALRPESCLLPALRVRVLSSPARSDAVRGPPAFHS
jgi:hypothetical protein